MSDNKALTLEQLREMEGQPVWVKCLKPNKYINPPVRWRILEKSIMGTFGVWDGESCLSERDYGTDWLAYRRPPEGDCEIKTCAETCDECGFCDNTLASPPEGADA